MSPKSDITGIFLLDKELGDTSNAALQKAKKLWRAKKAGHTGSLDPLASGMLPICFGEATKIVRFLLDANKSYQVKIALGCTTTTGDAQGTALRTRAIPHLSIDEIENILSAFRGPILQIPPNYSAIKQNGKRLYELARAGREIEIEKKARPLHIYKLILEGYEYHNQNTAYLSLHVHCSKGTYIRSLAEDIGEKMGCGAHVIALRRLAVEPFDAYPMLKLSELTDMGRINHVRADLLLKPEQAIPHIPKIQVSQEDCHALYQGKQVSCKNDDLNLGWVQLWSQSSETFFGIGEKGESGLIAPRRLFNLSELC